MNDHFPAPRGPELPPEDEGVLAGGATPEEVQRQELQGHPDALGRAAVDAAQKQADIAVTGEDTGRHARRTARRVSRARREVRGVLRRAGPEQVAEFLEVEDMPLWLREATDSQEDPKQLAANLANKRKMDEATAVNVLQWRAHRLSETQKTYERETLPMLRGEFSRLTHNAIAAGWMPAKVADRLALLDKTPVYHDDGFGTGIDDANANDKRILMGLQRKANVGAFLHEGTHVLAGRGYPDMRLEGLRGDALTEIFRTRFGTRSIWIREAVTERIARGLLSGDINNPAERGIHPEVQEVLDTVCTAGVKPVDIQLFVNAYYEDKSERDALGKESAAAKLIAAIEAAYPRMNIMHELTLAKDPTIVDKLKQEGQKGAPAPVAAALYKLRNGLRVGDYYKRLLR